MLLSTYTIIGVMIQGLVAFQISSVALIYPQRSDITVDEGTDLTMGCRGAEPMRWVFNDDINGPKFSTSQKNITNIYNDKELEYKYETILIIYNVSHVNIGFYYCHGEEVDFNTPRRSSRIYVFVDGNNHLSVITSKNNKFIRSQWLTFIPCRPTALDINITLTCNDARIVMSLNPANYTAVHQNEDYVIKFNSYYGFAAEYQRPFFFLHRCTCDFTRNKRTFTIKLSRDWSPYLRTDVSIAGPATANVGSKITVQCTYLHDQYFPYDKYWPHWDVPINGLKHTEILQVVKLKTYVLLINLITMNNISTENIGNYKCEMDPRLKLNIASSKYIYVNENKSNYSAPWIYSPNEDEIQINTGENVTLRCAGSRPVTWAVPQRGFCEVEDVPNISGLYETYLHFTKVHYRATGLYYCHETGSPINYPFTSDKIYIFVKDKQNLYIPLKDELVAHPYTNVTVPCLPTSRDVNVTLSMLHEVYDPDIGSRVWQMIIPVIYAYDPREGFNVQMPGPDGDLTATCIFVTETGETDTMDILYSMSSSVISEPLITGPYEDLVFVGQTLELSCTVFVYYNVPDDTLRWVLPIRFSSSQIIEEMKRINFRLGKILINKLTLHDVKDSNAGRYFCHLTSNNATASKVISVFDQFAVMTPFIENLTKNYAYIGKALVLRCKVNVDHNVDFQMSWTTPKGTEIQNLSIEYIRIVRNIFGEIVLKVDNTTNENEGNYSCNVFYSTNRRNYTTKYILVKKGEKSRIVTSNFEDQGDIVALLDETVNLTCSAEGDPKPAIIWTKDSTEVQVLGQHIGFTADNSELTVYYVQRFDVGRYTCIAQNPFGRDSRTVHLRLKTVSLIPYYTIAIFIIILIIIASVLLVRQIFKQKKFRTKLNEAGFITLKSGELQHLNPFLNMTEQAALLFYDTKWEIPRYSIELGRNLGSGYFGLVVKATISNFFDGEPEKTVAVKMLHRNCNIIELNSLICELKILTLLEEHVNLINLIGACTETIAEGNLLIVIEYCEHGSLRNYLRENRSSFVNLIDPHTELICLPDNDNDSLQDAACRGSGNVSTLQLLRWALQVARGMEFLASKQILHGDLAARNVLLDENYVVKISDFGLSKTLSSSGYYKKTSQCPLPIKWMAIESIRDKTFSTQSDVWAFGVVLWELFSLARTPYSELEPDFRFYRKLESGYRLKRPEYSTREIYQVMRECWCELPQRRPIFSYLVCTLDDLLQDPNKSCSEKNELAHDAAVCVFAADQINHTTPRDWIALDILPHSSTIDKLL